jgi:hypothetical protein
MCNTTSEQKRRLVVVYDNACNWLYFMLLRFPSLTQQITTLIDAMHHAGHSDCSKFFNTKLHSLAQNLNVALNEQKNRIINYMKSTASQMAQIRMMQYCMYHLAMLNLAQIGMKEIETFLDNKGKSSREGELSTTHADESRIPCLCACSSCILLSVCQLLDTVTSVFLLQLFLQGTPALLSFVTA